MERIYADDYISMLGRKDAWKEQRCSSSTSQVKENIMCTGYGSCYSDVVYKGNLEIYFPKSYRGEV